MNNLYAGQHTLYHGSENWNFSQFKPNSFFSDSELFAEDYGNTKQFLVAVNNPFNALTYDHITLLFTVITELVDPYDGEVFSCANAFFESNVIYGDNWEIFEQENVLRAIKGLGFDSIMITEGGCNNYLIFDCSSIKVEGDASCLA